MTTPDRKQWWYSLLALAGLALPGVTQAQTVYYLHTDIQGSVVAVTDQNRNVVERREYEPYGLPRDPIADGPGYTGHDHDGDSGLVYAQQRYYDPKVGQFLSVDPVGVDPTGGANFNRYWYGNDNPYKFVDPDGMQACQQDEQPCSDTKKAEERRNERRSKAGPGFVQSKIVLHRAQGPTWPTNHSEVTSGYEPTGREHPTEGYVRPHNAIDIKNPQGDPVYSILDGEVVDVSSSAEAGNFIKVDHANNLQSSYSHTASSVGIGDPVTNGQIIGTSDGSGLVTAPHLHFVIRENGIPVDPCTILSCQ